MTATQTPIAEEYPLVGAPGAAHTAAAVSAHEVTRSYGEAESCVQALRGVSLEVPSGQFAAVMGPSGSGKSTLMHILAGLDAATSGSVAVDGQAIDEMNDRELTLLRRGKIGFIFQAFNLLPMLTAEENILLPLAIAGRRADRNWVESVLSMVKLSDRRSHRPAQLSGGQQQRVAIARALVSEPAILFADEPTGNLDSQTGQDILALLRQATDVHGQTTLMVTHDPRAAAAADRVVFIADGLLMADLPRPTEDAVLDLMKEVSR